MKFKSLLNESYECVKIGGILRNLSNDEMKIYKKVKKEGKVFKQDLDEYDANVATTMVSKGLLRRKKLKDPNSHFNGCIYYTTIGRKGHLVRKEMDEVAPPGQESEKWIKKNKKRFKDKYGKDYEKYLYGKAWNNYNGKRKLSESIDNMNSFYNDFKKCYESCIDGQNRIENSGNMRFENVFVYTFNVLNNFIEEYYYKFNQHRDDDDKSYKIYKNLDSIYNRIQDLWQSMRDDASSSGDYAVYDDDVYNAEKTHENIYNYGFPETISRYIDTSTAWEWFARQTALVAEASANLEESSTEPEFDGNFDNVSQTKSVNLSDENKEIIEQCKEFIKLVNNNTETPEKCMEYLDDIYNSYSNDILDRVRSNILEKLYDYVDENLSGETNLEIISVTEGEFNDDKTMDMIWDLNFEDLVDKFLNKSEAIDFINDSIDNLDYIKNILDVNNKDMSSEDESGSEYDE